MQMAKGATWMIAARLVIRLLGLISTLILVRLLLPEDFGLVALATAVVAGLELIKTFSFDVALIQDQSADAQKYNVAWTLNLIFGLGIGIALAVIAIPVSGFYEDPRLAPIFYAFALSMVFQSFENIGIVDFRKHLEFDKEFTFLVVKKLSGFLITVPLAFALRSYWALVIGVVLSHLISTIASFMMHPYRPRLALRGASDLIGFSKWLLANNILYFLRHRSAEFILGKSTGTRAVGLYSVAYEISHLITNELVAPINRAVFPGYAKMADDIDALRDGYVKVMSMIALASIPAATGIAATADLLVPVMLGPNWIEAVGLIQILAFSGAIAILETNIGAAYLAMGKPHILTFLFAIFAGSFIILLLILVPRFGSLGAAWASIAAGLINVLPQIYLMRRTLGISLSDLTRIFFRPIASSFAMYFVVRAFIAEIDAVTLSSQAAFLALSAAIGVIVYVSANLALWVLAGRPSGAEELVLELSKQGRSKLVEKFRKQ